MSSRNFSKYTTLRNTIQKSELVRQCHQFRYFCLCQNTGDLVTSAAVTPVRYKLVPRIIYSYVCKIDNYCYRENSVKNFINLLTSPLVILKFGAEYDNDCANHVWNCRFLLDFSSDISFSATTRAFQCRKLIGKLFPLNDIESLSQVSSDSR